MSDFFTKKQKKFWCDKCRIFIEYTKISIEKHNTSKNHLRMSNSDQSYQNFKNKINRHNLSNYGVENENIKKSQFLKNKHSRGETEFEYSSGYGREISNINLDKNNLNKNESFSSGNLLEDIKKEKMRQMVKEKFNIVTKTKNERIWSIFVDPNTQQPFYYNFVTQISQWEKPQDYDGPELENVNNIIPTNNVTNLGKWQTVDHSESFFEKNKAKEIIKKDYIPGVISYEDYTKLAMRTDLDIDQDYEEEIEITNRKNDFIEKILYQPNKSENNNIEKYTIDKFINENEINQDVVKENKVENSYTNKIRLISKNYVHEECNEDENPKEDVKITISFNKNQKKINSIFDDEDE